MSLSISTIDVKNKSGLHLHQTLSNLKPYGFAISIILSIGGITLLGIGLAGYFQVGALSHLSQIHAITTMSIGGCCTFAGGIFALVSLKARNKSLIKTSEIKEKISQPSHSHAPKTTKTGQCMHESEKLCGEIYGLEAWNKLNVKVLGNVPQVPHINWTDKPSFLKGKTLQDCMLIFIPEKVLFQEREERMTLNLLEKINGKIWSYYNPSIKQELGDVPLKSGWVLMTKSPLSESENKSYEEQETLLNHEGFRMPTIGEVVMGIMMHEAHTKEILYKIEANLSTTRTQQKYRNKYPVQVGPVLASKNISIDFSNENPNIATGVTAVKTIVDS
jgi:hypothetical protein